MKNLQAIDDDKARATLWEDPLCKSVVGENAPVACCLPTAPLISISFMAVRGHVTSLRRALICAEQQFGH